LGDTPAVLGLGGTGAVEVLGGGAAGGGGESFLAGEVLPGQGQGGLGLIELGLKGGDFRRAFAFFGVFQFGAGLGQLPGGLVARGYFRGVVEREKGIAGADLVAALDGQGGERPGQRGRDIDKFSLHVALDGRGMGRAATGQKAEEGQKQKPGRRGEF